MLIIEVAESSLRRNRRVAGDAELTVQELAHVHLHTTTFLPQPTG